MLKRIFQSGGMTGLLVAMILALGLALYRLRIDYAGVEKETANLQNKLAEVQRDAAELERQNAQASDPAYLEQQARLKLNYKKPDENVVFIYRNQYDGKTDPADGQEIKADSRWRKLLSWVEKLLK